jgi:hypothetical protein
MRTHIEAVEHTVVFLPSISTEVFIEYLAYRYKRTNERMEEASKRNIHLEDDLLARLFPL